MRSFYGKMFGILKCHNRYFFIGVATVIVLNASLPSSSKYGDIATLESPDSTKPSVDLSDPTSTRTFKSSENNRAYLLQDEIQISGVLCIHKNHITSFLNLTLRDFANDIRTLDDYFSISACNLVLVIKERKYSTVFELKHFLQNTSFHSLRVFERQSFLIFNSKYINSVNLDSNLFFLQRPTDYDDYESLIHWYKHLNSLRSPLTPDAYESSSSPWIYFNYSHVFRADSDIVDPAPLEDCMRYHIKSLFASVGEEANRVFHCGWFQFLPENGIKAVVLYGDNKIIRGFKEKSDEPLMIPMPFVKESQKIHIISPVFSSDIWKLSRHTNVKINTKLNIHRHIVFDFNANPENNSRFTSYRMKNLSNASIFDIISRVLPNISEYSQPLVFYSHTSKVNLTKEFLNRIRLNVLLGRQVFSPIPFVHFKRTLPTLYHTRGFFDSNIWSFLGFYSEDYSRLLSSIKNKRNEGLHILRAPDPNLILNYGIANLTDGIKHLGERSVLSKLALDYSASHPDTHFEL